MKRYALALTLCSLLASSLPAAETADPDAPRKVPLLVLGDAEAVAGAPASWDGRDWGRFGLAALAVAGTAVLLDRPVRDLMVRNQRGSWNTAARRLEPLGAGYAWATAGGFYLAGWAAGKDEVRATGTDAIAATLISEGMIGPVLKYGLGRARPNEVSSPGNFQPLSGKESFPSGHVLEAFTVASVIAEHNPQPGVQVAAYGLASLVGLARLEQNAHWSSDVVAGALIGTAVGRAVVRRNQELRVAGRSVDVSLVPDLRPDYRGVRLVAKF